MKGGVISQGGRGKPRPPHGSADVTRFYEGFDAARRGLAPTACPHDDQRRRAWLQGHQAACDEGQVPKQHALL